MEEKELQNPELKEGQQAVESSNEEGKKENPSNPPQEGDEKSEESKSSEEAKKAEEQSKEENAKFAKMRHERDMAKAKAAGDAEGYKRARIKSVGGKNPYTETPIETDEDFEFYELQDEVKANGGDPKNPWEVEKLRRDKAEKAKKEAEDSRTEKEKSEAKAAQEVKDYLDAGHTQKELQSYWNNPTFMEFAEDLLGVVPLTSIINKFDKAYPKGDPQAKKEVAKKASSPGSASNDEQEVPQKKISEMTPAEFEKYRDEVMSGKRKID